MWNRLPPPGFQGLREDLALRVYTRHLPHWRQDGATYFVTFRLADSLPQAKLRELRALRGAMARDGVRRTDCNPSYFGRREYATREIMRRVECWLDQGMGSCLLRNSENAKLVADTLRYFDGQRYELGCYVVMPNHVHAMVRPLDATGRPLERILQTWKRRSASALAQQGGLESPIWQEESFDRIIRDEEHLYRAIQYIGTNPAKAGLTVAECRRWICPSWAERGWGFADVAHA
jgi:REP element-mobilizing transposase RayT